MNMEKPILENEKVRVLKIQLKPGEKTPKHSHPDYVVCVMSNQKLRITDSNGETKEFDLSFGDVLYSEQTTHVVENIGETDSMAYVIELK